MWIAGAFKFYVSTMQTNCVCKTLCLHSTFLPPDLPCVRGYYNRGVYLFVWVHDEHHSLPPKKTKTLGWGLGSSILPWWWSPRMPAAPDGILLLRSELWIIPFWGKLTNEYILGGYPISVDGDLPSVANGWQLLICSHFGGGRNWRSTELNREPTNPFCSERSELEVKGLEFFGLHWVTESSGNCTLSTLSCFMTEGRLEDPKSFTRILYTKVRENRFLRQATSKLDRVHSVCCIGTRAKTCC